MKYDSKALESLKQKSHNIFKTETFICGDCGHQMRVAYYLRPQDGSTLACSKCGKIIFYATGLN